VWWLSLDGQFRLPFNEADSVALAASQPRSDSDGVDSCLASLALDPRVFLLAAAGHYGTTGRTPRQLSQLVNWLAVALQNRWTQLEPIPRRRRTLMRKVQKRRESYLRHLRGGSDIWELRRQLERLVRNCGKYPGKWKARKLVNRWVTDELLNELAELNPLELVAAIIFPDKSREQVLKAADFERAAVELPILAEASSNVSQTQESNRQTEDLLPSETLEAAAQTPSIDECGSVKGEIHGHESASQFDPAAFQQLLQTEKLAALRQLAYGASHEINNPLANIAMRAEMLLRGEPDPDRQRKLQVIRQQAMRAHEMISDLMLFANPPRPTLQAIELPSWLTQLGEELQPDVQLADAELVIEATTEQTVVGDPVQLAEAVRALVRNSLEAQPARARIRVATGVDAQGAAYFEVSDNGPGISDEIARHMFDPFFSGREAGRGLGFGLPKAWRIAESHGGQLCCLNRSTGQTRFRLSWPRLQAPAKAA
jgi:signal transduction histidine kinase